MQFGGERIVRLLTVPAASQQAPKGDRKFGFAGSITHGLPPLLFAVGGGKPPSPEKGRPPGEAGEIPAGAASGLAQGVARSGCRREVGPPCRTWNTCLWSHFQAGATISRSRKRYCLELLTGNSAGLACEN